MSDDRGGSGLASLGPLLIANRGEIACRVIGTARRLGLATVAVHSEADRAALHVRRADRAFCLGPAPARESYLRIDRILEAARATGARSVHPGYGFLSENPEFAAACAEAGLVFVGPTVSAIRAMGSKSEAKRLMEVAGVPLVPGEHGDDQSLQHLETAARKIGFPVLIKASAGGGGRGMRIVEAAGHFSEALASCRREAKASFGDDRVLVEKYVESPRHVEFQIFCDAHGGAVHLFERDCSVQRRHQKVVEEAPAPDFTPAQREVMGKAAVQAARAVDYVGAGTVEFLLAPDGAFYFMEMNTRLQVEHPVTEMVTGEDLVEWQLRVAAGERLPKAQHELDLDGHSIEVRLYAEDPAKRFLPSVGRLEHLSFPAPSEFVRVETGVESGAAVTPHYDPMLAKLVVWDRNRDAARRRLVAALRETHVVGVATNVDFLARVLECESFARGDVDTGLIEKEGAALEAPAGPPPAYAWLAAALGARLEAGGAPATWASDPHSPFDETRSWRLNAVGEIRIELEAVGETRAFVIRSLGDGFEVETGVGTKVERYRVRAAWTADGQLDLTVEDVRHRVAVVSAGDVIHVFGDDGQLRFERIDRLRPRETGSEGPDELRAPMPGRVTQVHVEAGQKVRAGDALVVVEAMKMEHTLKAPTRGVVRALHCAVGDNVPEGFQLVELDAAPAKARKR